MSFPDPLLVNGVDPYVRLSSQTPGEQVYKHVFTDGFIGTAYIKQNRSKTRRRAELRLTVNSPVVGGIPGPSWSVYLVIDQPNDGSVNLASIKSWVNLLKGTITDANIERLYNGEN